MNYTVWVVPPKPLFNDLETIIEQLAREYEGPMFIPHLSILTNIESDLSEVDEKFRELAKATKPLHLNLEHVSFSNTYFQSVYVRINSTAELMQLNFDAKKHFNREKEIYMPHISLIYGNHDMKLREKIASSINLPSASFVVDELIITPNDDPYDGKRIATIPLGGS